MREMEKVVRIVRSHEEADAADVEEDLRSTPEQRIDTVLDAVVSRPTSISCLDRHEKTLSPFSPPLRPLALEVSTSGSRI
jgi:hypothetical protein